MLDFLRSNLWIIAMMGVETIWSLAQYNEWIKDTTPVSAVLISVEKRAASLAAVRQYAGTYTYTYLGETRTACSSAGTWRRPKPGTQTTIYIKQEHPAYFISELDQNSMISQVILVDALSMFLLLLRLLWQ